MLGRHLQHHGVEGQPYGRNGDAVLVSEVGERLDVGIDGIERHGAVADGADRLHLVGGAARLLPERQQRGQGRGAVVGSARQQRVEDGAGTAQRGGCRFDLAEAELGRLLPAERRR